jgi:hypothetical protein
MSIGQKFRESFSPYEISLIWLATAAAWTVLAISVAMVAGPFAFALVCLCLAPVGFIFEGWSRCPVCGKPPLKRSKQGVGWFALYVMKYRYRLWPEKECSECRHPLDLIVDPQS